MSILLSFGAWAISLSSPENKKRLPELNQGPRNPVTMFLPLGKPKRNRKRCARHKAKLKAKNRRRRSSVRA